MNKRKCSEDETDKEEEEDDEDIWDSSSIPLPIQTFLWRQTRYAQNFFVNIF